MQNHFLRLVLAGIVLILLLGPGTASAQLNATFEDMFNTFLRTDLFTQPTFERVYDQAAIDANSVLVPAMSNMIGSNVAAFPLPSTVAGIYFDLSGSGPEMQVESLGPLYAETAESVGRNKLNLGVNFAHYSLEQFRGMQLDDMRFTFTATDLNGDGMLGSPTQFALLAETETMEVFPDLNIDANTAVFFATYGITSALDFGVAVPFINLSVSGQARAVIKSTSFLQTGTAIARFNNDLINPLFTDTFNYDESASGLGDLSLRLKYGFVRGEGLDVAALVDVRLPTGNEDDFLGTGETNVKGTLILSQKTTDFSPHFNITYDHHGSEFDSDEIELFFGFDQKINSSVTFILDILAEYDLESDKIQLFPGSRQLFFSSPPPNSGNSFMRDVELSNIPENSRDNRVNASVGIKIAPSRKSLIMANILVPLQEGGLRSSVVPLIGAAITF